MERKFELTNYITILAIKIFASLLDNLANLKSRTNAKLMYYCLVSQSDCEPRLRLSEQVFFFMCIQFTSSFEARKNCRVLEQTIRDKR